MALKTPNTHWINATPGLAVTLLLLLFQFADVAPLRAIANQIFDSYQRAAPRDYRDAPVRVVDIDDESIRRLGQWPWPRTDIARLTQELSDAGASAIAFDMVFSERDRTSPARIAQILRANPAAHGDYAEVAALTDHDTLLAQSFANAPVVLGHFLLHTANSNRPEPLVGMAMLGVDAGAAAPGFSGAITPLPILSVATEGSGFISLTGDSDGIIRHAPLVARLGETIIPSLSLEALRVAQGAGSIVVRGADASGEFGKSEPAIVKIKVGAFEIPTTRSGDLWLYYTRPVPGRIVPAWKILSGEYSAAQLQSLIGGRIVFIGTGAAGLRDLVSTPVSDRDLGVVVHAQMAEQIILGQFLMRPDWAPGVETLALLLAGVGLALVLPYLGALRGGLIALLFAAIILGGSWAGFVRGHLLLDPTLPMLGIMASYSALTLFGFYREERQRRYIRGAFDRFLAPELVERIVRDPSQLELGGEEREMTVLFADIRGFSALSEHLTPQAIIGFLIAFLTPMTDILLGRKATIDKYIGDAVLAFWNAPLDDPDHARNAAYAALEMREKLAKLNINRPPNWPGEVRIGIGLNTGICCVGNMGSVQRLAYSLIGDTVNLASRLEGLTKTYAVPIILGETLAAAIGDFALLEIDKVKVVGRDQTTRIFTLIGAPALVNEPDFAALQSGFAAMLLAYRAMAWDQAEAALQAIAPILQRCELTLLGDVFVCRIAALRAAPPPPDWDGIFQSVEK